MRFENRNSKFETRNSKLETRKKKLDHGEARIPILLSHSERSEESLQWVSPGTAEILRCAQNDRPSLSSPSSSFPSRLSVFDFRSSLFEFRFSFFEFRISSFDSGILIPSNSVPHQAVGYSRHRGRRLPAVLLLGSPAKQGVPHVPPESL